MVGARSVESIASVASTCFKILWLGAFPYLTPAAHLPLTTAPHSYRPHWIPGWPGLGVYLAPVDELCSRSSHLRELREEYKNEVFRAHPKWQTPIGILLRLSQFSPHFSHSSTTFMISAISVLFIYLVVFFKLICLLKSSEFHFKRKCYIFPINQRVWCASYIFLTCIICELLK